MKYILSILAILSTLVYIDDAIGISAPSTYPGCASPDIVIGGQIWASCNVSTRSGKGSATESMWYYYGQKISVASGTNGTVPTIGKVSTQQPRSTWGAGARGPCVKGYKVPTRYDWETAVDSARRNNTRVYTMLGLPQNGAYTVTTGYRDQGAYIESRKDTAGMYWASTPGMDDYMGTALYIATPYTSSMYGAGRYDATMYDTGLDSTESISGGRSVDIANVRCIRG